MPPSGVTTVAQASDGLASLGPHAQSVFGSVAGSWEDRTWSPWLLRETGNSESKLLAASEGWRCGHVTCSRRRLGGIHEVDWWMKLIVGSRWQARGDGLRFR
jgi:hypothetical protein